VSECVCVCVMREGLLAGVLFCCTVAPLSSLTNLLSHTHLQTHTHSHSLTLSLTHEQVEAVEECATGPPPYTATTASSPC
jgi:hypothetical protein